MRKPTSRFSTSVWVAASLAIVGPATIHFAVQAAEPAPVEDRYWTLEFSDLLKEGTRPLVVYARDRDGQWIAAVGSSLDTTRGKGKTFNKSFGSGGRQEGRDT